MNKLNIQQIGGFPLTTNTLNFMQASYLLMQNFGEMAGDLTIINGCEVNGTQVSSGTVFIEGELLPFEGGTLGTNVIIQEDQVEKEFEDGTAKPVEIIRTAKFGNGTKVYKWQDFTRIQPLKILQRSLTPVGSIIIWSGMLQNIPEGWVICDGENDTPDLRNRFVLGSDDENIGEPGGADEITLKGVNLPPHHHYVNISASHKHSFRDTYLFEGAKLHASLGGIEYIGRDNMFGAHKSDVDNGYLYYKNRDTAYATAEVRGYTDYAGGLNNTAQPFSVLPPYVKLIYIMFKG